MAIFSLNSTVIARAAGGLYGLKIGTSTMNEALAAANASSVDALFNALYTRDFGTAKVADVAAALVKNVGITGAGVAEATTYVTGQLTASTNKGATVVAILNAFSNLTDATFGPAAARFNAQVNASVQYAQTAGNQDAAFDALGTNAGAAFNLTNIGDIATATVFNANQVYTPGGTSLINSLQNDDSLTGAGTADVLNATLGNPNDNGVAEITPELKGIETLNLKFDSTSSNMILDMQDSAGTVNVNISRIADGKSATVKNITEAATNKLSINNTNSPTTGTVTLSYTDDATSAAAQTVDLTLSNAKAAAVVLQAASTNFGFETINLKSSGSSNSIGTFTAQDVQSLVITGDKNLNIGTTADTTGTQGVEATRYGAGLANVSGSLTSVNASALTGNLSLTVGSEINGALDNTSGLSVRETITGGSGNDTIRLTDGATVGGSTTNTDVIDGGAGTDTIVMVGSSTITASGTSTAPVANVKSIEALQIRSGHDAGVAAEAPTVDANAFDALATIYVRNEGQDLVGAAWTSAAETLTATLNNLTAAQATGVTIAHGTTGNNGITGTTLAVNLKTSTGTSDTVGVTIVDGVNADVRSNFILSTTGTENLTLTDSDTETNTVALASVSQHTGTVTLAGGTAATTLNLDTTTAGANGGLSQLSVTGNSTDITASVADQSLTTGQVKISALTIAAGDFKGDIIARVTNPTATASATGSQSITLGTGNDILILDNTTNLTAGLGITDTLAGGTGTDTLVIDGANDGGVSLSASEFTNVTGFETFRFINNGRAAANGRTDTNSYSLALNDAAVTQNAAASTTGSLILNIVNDNGSANTTGTTGGPVQTNGGITIDVRALSATRNINYDGQETDTGGTLTVNATSAAVTLGTALTNVTAMTADRFIFADANINATAVIDGGADRTGTPTTGNGGGIGHGRNADVLEVRNAAVVSLGDLAGIRNVSNIEFTNDTASVQTSVLQVSDAVVEAMVNSSLTTVSTNATTIANSYEVLTITGVDSPNVTGAFTQLNLDGSLIVNEANRMNITAGAGADTIYGGAGADSINGAGGNDVFGVLSTAAVANDTIDGGADTDTVYIAGTVAFSTTDANLIRVENVTMAAGSSVTLTGQTEAFTITGSTGNETIVGGGAGDNITGGTGADALTGGGGADTFVFANTATGAPTDANFDTISDYVSGTDIIDFTTAIIKFATAVTAASGTAGVVVTTGVTSFNAADSTLALKITAIAAALGTAAAGNALIFQHTTGSSNDSFLYITDGTAGAGATDVLIKLTGITGTGADEITVNGGGDLTSLG